MALRWVKNEVFRRCGALTMSERLKLMLRAFFDLPSGIRASRTPSAMESAGGMCP